MYLKDLPRLQKQMFQKRAKGKRREKAQGALNNYNAYKHDNEQRARCREFNAFRDHLFFDEHTRDSKRRHYHEIPSHEHTTSSCQVEERRVAVYAREGRAVVAHLGNEQVHHLGKPVGPRVVKAGEAERVRDAYRGKRKLHA